MLRELLSIFKKDDPLASMGGNFTAMLEISREMTLSAGRIFFAEDRHAEARTEVYERDVEVNRLQRTIRKQVVAHLAIQSNTPNLPYCLALMSLVKDIERIGDYAKNLSEVMDIQPDPWPQDDLIEELGEIRHTVESQFVAAAEVFGELDRERALELIERGRANAQRSDGLVSRIARSQHPPPVVAGLVLGARHYKRIGGHVLNVLSSVVMPLHKIDYFDEDEVPGKPAG
jgi:phosphate uptake regulator